GNPASTPPLLLHHLRHIKALHQTIVLITLTTQHVPRVLRSSSTLTQLTDGFYRLQLHIGFMESPNVPRALSETVAEWDLPIVMNEVTYFLSRETLLATDAREMSAKEEQLFSFLSRNAQSAARYFCLPPRRVVEIGVQIDL